MTFIDTNRLQSKEPRKRLREVGPGYAAIIPPDAAHSVKALTDAPAIAVDHPPRYSIAGIEL